MGHNEARPATEKSQAWPDRQVANAESTTRARKCQPEKPCNMGRTALSYVRENGHGEAEKILL